MRLLPAVLAVAHAAACAAPAAATAPAARPAPAQPVSPSCSTVEHRQFDFWLGDWDLVVRAQNPGGDGWAEARATQRIESILGGCAISETFNAEGPVTPWRGRSFSMWQAKAGKWRQTWVDDQGGYLAFTGGLEAGVMTLYGEPFDRDGKTVQMRMVFLEVTADALRWEWQRSTDGGATWAPTMIIAYRRHAPRAAPPDDSWKERAFAPGN